MSLGDGGFLALYSVPKASAKYYRESLVRGCTRTSATGWVHFLASLFGKCRNLSCRIGCWLKLPPMIGVQSEQYCTGGNQFEQAFLSCCKQARITLTLLNFHSPETSVQVQAGLFFGPVVDDGDGSQAANGWRCHATTLKIKGHVLLSDKATRQVANGC